ncbi:MAG: hypothetical protein Q9P01_16075 [Anaerolineae bacterium]|nr:hypothetical protein [Anaerolineae bacterium]MDQ7036286.1 hypothetical protein [Anaerolineae bacterium]
MINGVLQPLTIVEISDTRLVLREQPRLAWFIAGILFAIAAILLLFQFWGTAFLAFVIACIFLVDARTRLICFDTHTHTMTVDYVYLYRRKTINVTELHKLGEAYLHTAADGHSQIILIDKMSNEMGFSVYSRDIRPWKEDIVVAINTILRNAQKAPFGVSSRLTQNNKDEIAS